MGYWVNDIFILEETKYLVINLYVNIRVHLLHTGNRDVELPPLQAVVP